MAISQYFYNYFQIIVHEENLANPCVVKPRYPTPTTRHYKLLCITYYYNNTPDLSINLVPPSQLHYTAIDQMLYNVHYL